MEIEIEYPHVYEPVFSDFHKECCCKHLWYSPRTSWKSSGLGRIILLYYLNYPQYDVCIGVDSLTNAGDGVLAEFQSFVESEGLNENNEWVFGTKSAYRKGRDNQIRTYAVQTNRHDNVSTTKGKKLIRPLSLFVMDEVQKLHNKKILLNSTSTFLRQMKSGHSKAIFAGNPDHSSMWFDQFYKDKCKDRNWVAIKPTYKDISEWIPDALLSEIEDLRVNDPVEYKQIYLGDLDAAGWEQVFHSFIRDEHYIPRQQLMLTDKGRMDKLINSIIIGVDDAQKRDAIAASSITVHTNGQMRVQESLYLSCKELPVKPALTQRCDILISFLDYIQKHFNPEREIPLFFSIDDSHGLCAQMGIAMSTDPNYMRWRNVHIFPYTKKDTKEYSKEKQLGLINSAFSNGTLLVVNVDSYSPRYSNEKLVEQIKALRLMENGKIDPTIPNDCTDALQYGAMQVLMNPYNLTFPKRLKQYKLDNPADVMLDRLREQENEKGRTFKNAAQRDD